MIINKVELTNFRNHDHYIFDCDQKTSLIIGANGFGKTSILEAIYILTRGKSFRATDKDIIKRGSEFYRIKLKYINGEEVVAIFDNLSKTFIALDKKTKRLPSNSKYPIILFLPSDLNLISSSPGKRRDYLDLFFNQLDEEYHKKTHQYNKALRQRNDLLKKENITKNEIFSWNIILSKYGTEINQKRNLYIQEINDKINQIYHSIAENDDSLLINYVSDASNLDHNKYLKQLEDLYRKDRALGYTSFGVHRDDYVFIFNNQIADGSASRGETRSIILAMKFIEAEMIYQKLGKKPLILLDDVFSELDEKRRQCLVKNFKDHQVIITSVENV